MTQDHSAVDAYVDSILASAPPLSASQKDRLRTLLAPRPSNACAIKACPSLTTPCAFHAHDTDGHRGTDRLIRQRPGDAERGGGRMPLAEAS